MIVTHFSAHNKNLANIVKFMESIKKTVENNEKRLVPAWKSNQHSMYIQNAFSTLVSMWQNGLILFDVWCQSCAPKLMINFWGVNNLAWKSRYKLLVNKIRRKSASISTLKRNKWMEWREEKRKIY